MKLVQHIKLIMLSALIVGGSLGVGMPMHAQASQDNSASESIATSSTDDSATATNDLATEGSEDGEEAASTKTKPEYKYVPVRRF